MIFLGAELAISGQSLIDDIRMPHGLDHTVHKAIQFVWAVAQLEVEEGVVRDSSVPAIRGCTDDALLV